MPKEWNVTPSNRSFSTKSIYKQTAFQDGDSQVSKTIDNGQRLGCLHRSDGCTASCSDTSDIQKIPSVHLRTSGLSVQVLTLRNVLKSVENFTKLMVVIAVHLRQRVISVFPYLDDWLIRDLIRNRLISYTSSPL